MPQKHAIGIDLGTSTSEICVFRPEGCQAIGDPASPSVSPIVPSLVALNNDGELVVGEEARPWVDLPGGGTLDITVLEMVFGVLDVKCSFGDSQLGGKDFDEILRHLIAQKFQIQHPGVTIDPIAAGLLKSAAETVKLALTTKESHGVHL